MICKDRYSGYIFVHELGRNLKISAVTGRLERYMWEFGIARSMWTDGGPQMRKPMTDWAKKLGIMIDTSSA